MPNYVHCAMCRVKVATPPPPSWVEVPTGHDFDQAFLCEDCAAKFIPCTYHGTPLLELVEIKVQP